MLVPVSSEDLENVPDPLQPADDGVGLVGVDVEPEVVVGPLHRVRAHHLENAVSCCQLLQKDATFTLEIIST